MNIEGVALYQGVILMPAIPVPLFAILVLQDILTSMAFATKMLVLIQTVNFANTKEIALSVLLHTSSFQEPIANQLHAETTVIHASIEIDVSYVLLVSQKIATDSVNDDSSL